MFAVYTIEPRLNHLEYGLEGRCRYPSPFLIKGRALHKIIFSCNHAFLARQHSVHDSTSGVLIHGDLLLDSLSELHSTSLILHRDTQLEHHLIPRLSPLKHHKEKSPLSFLTKIFIPLCKLFLLNFSLQLFFVEIYSCMPPYPLRDSNTH